MPWKHPWMIRRWTCDKPFRLCAYDTGQRFCVDRCLIFMEQPLPGGSGCFTQLIRIQILDLIAMAEVSADIVSEGDDHEDAIDNGDDVHSLTCDIG